jgi:tetratricopeptide (TPR) repeat protein
MKGQGTIGYGIAAIALVIFCAGTVGRAQGGAPSGGAGGGAAGASSMSGNIGRDISPLNPENSLELIRPVDRSEESAFREFQHVSTENMARKIELGEQFLKKYPKSAYRPIVYSGLTTAYLLTNQVQKMEEAGEMAIVLNPKDVQVLAMLGQTIPRVITANTPETQKQLEKAEKYAKQAIEQIPLVAKPANVSDQEFTQAKNQTLAIAHSGLALVDFRRGNLEGTIAELDQAAKLDPRGDATNYYVLGVANYNAKHYEGAAKAFTMCAEFSGNLQPTCKESAEKAKSLITGQQGVPK